MTDLYTYRYTVDIDIDMYTAALRSCKAFLKLIYIIHLNHYCQHCVSGGSIYPVDDKMLDIFHLKYAQWSIFPVCFSDYKPTFKTRL